RPPRAASRIAAWRSSSGPKPKPWRAGGPIDVPPRDKVAALMQPTPRFNTLLIRSLAVAAALPLFALPLGARAEEVVQIETPSPKPGETVKNKTDMAPIAGLAVAGERPTSFDVMLVLDVSESTEYPSGIDVDNDGTIGQTERSITPGVADQPCSDPDDS